MPAPPTLHPLFRGFASSMTLDSIGAVLRVPVRENNNGKQMVSSSCQE